MREAFLITYQVSAAADSVCGVSSVGFEFGIALSDIAASLFPFRVPSIRM